MLVLSRKIGERIVIEPGIEIAVVEVSGSRVRLGIQAPRAIGVRRMEVVPQPPTTSAADPVPASVDEPRRLSLLPVSRPR
ncbi:MAG: carbon storage regulator [Planctomycetaceae bacterium]